MAVKDRNNKVYASRPEYLKMLLEKNEAEKHRIENAKKEHKLGPRIKFLHYIYDEKMLMKDAVKKIIEEFPAISVDNIIEWYNEEERRRKREKERSNVDEER